jgi:hypothetical protein
MNTYSYLSLDPGENENNRTVMEIMVKEV